MSGLGDIGNLLKQAQQMQRELDKAEAELKGATVAGTAGGGAVRIELSGDGEVKRVEIKPDTARAGDARMLEELVLAALRDALSRARTLRKERMAKVTGGLNLPGVF
jgi:DNA-binding YbaB/EbfC family protein